MCHWLIKRSSDDVRQVEGAWPCSHGCGHFSNLQIFQWNITKNTKRARGAKQESGEAGWARGSHDGDGDGGQHERSQANKLDICCAARRHRDAAATTTINYGRVEQN